MILSSAQGYKVPEIARMYYLSEKYVRALIHRFNAEGLRSLNPRFNGPKIRGGGSRTFSEEEKAQIVELSLLRPKDLGYPFSRWSLDKLRLAILDRKIVDSISIEALRKILHSHNITIQRTRTWKESSDPNFKEKKERVRELVTNHAHHPEQGVVIALDEFGPLALRPELGANWAEMKKPDRVPATYSRGKGGQHLLAALDLTHDKLYGWTIPQKRWWRILAFLKYLKHKHPDTKLHVILDNHSTHKKEGVDTGQKEMTLSLHIRQPTHPGSIRSNATSFRSKNLCSVTSITRIRRNKREPFGGTSSGEMVTKMTQDYGLWKSGTRLVEDPLSLRKVNKI